ncbi:MAG: non-heme iron oxygenase ferredoxin subunit [Candidatus Omnitrophica bacterium]|nr:non-heme iron oxygenase ferredoxin subunit [Candidatus Omnitrophota bacterium]
MAWQKVAKLTDVKDGHGISVVAPGRKKPIAVFCCNGQFFALADECSHAYAPLSESDVENFIVTCRWHGAQFDVRSGKGIGTLAYADVRSFPVRIEDGSIEVEV